MPAAQQQQNTDAANSGTPRRRPATGGRAGKRTPQQSAAGTAKGAALATVETPSMSSVARDAPKQQQAVAAVPRGGAGGEMPQQQASPDDRHRQQQQQPPAAQSPPPPSLDSFCGRRMVSIPGWSVPIEVEIVINPFLDVPAQRLVMDVAGGDAASSPRQRWDPSNAIPAAAAAAAAADRATAAASTAQQDSGVASTRHDDDVHGATGDELVRRRGELLEAYFRAQRTLHSCPPWAPKTDKMIVQSAIEVSLRQPASQRSVLQHIPHVPGELVACLPQRDMRLWERAWRTEGAGGGKMAPLSAEAAEMTRLRACVLAAQRANSGCTVATGSDRRRLSQQAARRRASHDGA